MLWYDYCSAFIWAFYSIVLDTFRSIWFLFFVLFWISAAIYGHILSHKYVTNGNSWRVYIKRIDAISAIRIAMAMWTNENATNYGELWARFCCCCCCLIVRWKSIASLWWRHLNAGIFKTTTNRPRQVSAQQYFHFHLHWRHLIKLHVTQYGCDMSVS